MTLQSFFGVVPRRTRFLAIILGSCVAMAGWAAAGWAATRGAGTQAVLLYSVAALVLGAVTTLWILGVGFVFEDARRRAMRPFLWAAVVILFPHLLGFLLFFVLRQPLASRCPHCGQSVSPGQRFCSWCGAAQSSASPTGVPPPHLQVQQ